MTGTGQRLRRGRFTWLAYFMLGYFAFLQAVPGPLMPFLQAERGFSYSVAGLHFSAFALGAVAAGLTAERFVRRYGRARILWFSAVGMAGGALLLALGAHVAATIIGALIMGGIGSFTLAVIQAGLADYHGHGRAIALTEANVAASFCAGLAPLSVGLAARGPWSWRAGVLPALVGLVLIAFVFRKTAVPPMPVQDQGLTSRERPLPSLFWIFWAVLVFSISAEWSLIYWGAAYLEQVAGLPVEAAASAMSVFFLAAVTGRLLVSRLATRIATIRLLLASLLISMGGFLLFWLTRQAAFNVTGLFIAGLGISSVFPLGLAAATGLDPEQSDRASARILSGGGLAVLGAPFALGWLADWVGITSGYGLVLLLITLALALAAFAYRFERGLVEQGI